MLQTTSRSPARCFSTIGSSIADLIHGLDLLVGDIVQCRDKEIKLAGRAEAGTAVLKSFDHVARADALVEGQHLGDHGQVGGLGDPLDTGADDVVVGLASLTVG